MRKTISIIILSIMFIITLENDCESYNTSPETCENSHPNNKNCHYEYKSQNEGTCVEIKDTDVCQYDASNHKCIAKEGVKEPDFKFCDLGSFDNDGNRLCEFRNAYCYDYISSKEKCLSLQNCGYDEKREYDKCFSVNLDEGCQFENNKCTIQSTKEVCELKEIEGYGMYCKKRNIKCSDSDQDNEGCLKVELQDSTNVCSYDSSCSTGNKCFEVSIKEGCTYNKENKKCEGDDLSNGKICDMDYNENPVTCQKRNIQCNDFNGDETNCKSAILPDKSKECDYNSNNCIEKVKEAKCNFDEINNQCTSTLPSKIKCTVKDDKTGCEQKNVECSDFEEDSDGCNDAIISDSTKKCNYDSTKEENKCSEVSKDCSDFYNEQECNKNNPKNSLAKCVWSKECKEMTCETTSTENCGSFKPNDSSKVCTLNQEQNKCEETKPTAKEESTKNGAENLKIFLSIISFLIIF